MEMDDLGFPENVSFSRETSAFAPLPALEEESSCRLASMYSSPEMSRGDEEENLFEVDNGIDVDSGFFSKGSEGSSSFFAEEDSFPGESATSSASSFYVAPRSPAALNSDVLFDAVAAAPRVAPSAAAAAAASAPAPAPKEKQQKPKPKKRAAPEPSPPPVAGDVDGALADSDDETTGDTVSKRQRRCAPPRCSVEVAAALAVVDGVAGVAAAPAPADVAVDAAAAAAAHAAAAPPPAAADATTSARDGGNISAFIGVVMDGIFGPLVLCGMAKDENDVAFRLPPVSDIDAELMVSSLKHSAMLSFPSPLSQVLTRE
jgi:hypothetical protein